MKTLIIGGSGKIGSYLVNKKKNIIHTYFKNKIYKGIKFNIIKDDISRILNKHKISSVIFLSAISDPDICYKRKKYSRLLNVQKTKKILEKLIKKKIYFIFFSSEFIFAGNKGNYRVLVEAGIKFNNFLLENNYINDFYHFYSNESFGNKGIYNTKFFFNKMNKKKKSKREIKINLFQDKLIKFLLK